MCDSKMIISVLLRGCRHETIVRIVVLKVVFINITKIILHIINASAI